MNPFQLAISLIALVLTAIGIILSFYTIINRQNTSFKDALDKRFESLSTRAENIDRSTAVGFETIRGDFKLITLQINTILEEDVKELRLRLGKIESGQDEWTKKLRDRTHALGNSLEKLGYEVELLKIKCKDFK